MGPGDLGEALLDVLGQHGSGGGCGKILFLDLEDPLQVISQPVGSLLFEKCQGGDLLLADRIDEVFKLHTAPILGFPCGEEFKGAKKKPRPDSFGDLSDTEEARGIEDNLLVKPDIGCGEFIRDARGILRDQHNSPERGGFGKEGDMGIRLDDALFGFLFHVCEEAAVKGLPLLDRKGLFQPVDDRQVKDGRIWVLLSKLRKAARVFAV